MARPRFLTSALCSLAATLGLAAAGNAQVVISKIYAGGGTTGAVYISDFVELHNISDCEVDLAGWSLQSSVLAATPAASFTTGTANGTVWNPANLVGKVAPGGYFLIQLATPSPFSGTQGMPFPINSSGAVNLAQAGGKVALVRSTTALSGACPTAATIVDLVGWGTADCREGASAANNAAAMVSATDELIRTGGPGNAGCQDTGNNAADFFAVSTASFGPRNSKTTAVTCAGYTTIACCIASTGQCVPVASNGACMTAGGAPQAGCCVPNPCPVPQGTCCINNGCFTGQTQSFCTSVGGVWLGVGVSCTVPSNPCIPPDVVISQVFGGGGLDVAAPYQNDYVELFNRGSTPVDMTGWSLQFASATGAFTQNCKFSSNTGSKIIAPGKYYLIQLAAGASPMRPVLPTPDFDTIPLGSTQAFNVTEQSGRLALVTNELVLPSCPGLPRADVTDYVAYGSNPNCAEFLPTGIAGSSSVAFFRKGLGCQDTNNNNGDFMQPIAPAPHNSASAVNICDVNASGACCTSEVCSLTTMALCGGSFQGPTTTCMPGDPCAPSLGRCCRNTGVCESKTQSTCTALGDYVSWSLGATCTPNLCLGSCCTGLSCATSGRDQCTGSSSYWVFNSTCSASFCTQPQPTRVGDVVYGTSVTQNNDSVWQIRGATGSSATPTRVGTWSKYNFIEFVRFDNSFGVLHNARGNLIATDFGASPVAGATMFNLPTNGDAAAGQILYRMQAGDVLNPFNVPSGRYGGLAISTGNQYIAVIGYDNSRVLIFQYNAGTSIGTGTGASITNAWTVGVPGGTGPSDLSFNTLVSAGGVWIDNNTFAFVVRNNNPNFLDGMSQPIPLGPCIFTITMSGSGPGPAVFRVAPSDTGVDSSRVLGMAYHPGLSPYIYSSNSSFAGSTSNTLSIIDPATWTEVRAVAYQASCNTGRDIAIGPDRYLYFTQFAASANPAGTPLIDRLNLDPSGNGVVEPIDVAAINDNFVNTTVDFFLKPSAGNFVSSFTSLDVATGSSHVVCCRGTTCAQVLAAACLNNIPGVGVQSSNAWPCGSVASLAGCCYADFDKNGSVSIDDLFIYINMWLATSPYTKIGGDGVVAPSIDDLFVFINMWLLGCGA